MTRDDLIRHLQPWGARKRFYTEYRISKVTLWKWLTGRSPLPQWLAEASVTDLAAGYDSKADCFASYGVAIAAMREKHMEAPAKTA